MSVNIVKNFIDREYAQQIISGSEVFLEKAEGRVGYFENKYGSIPLPKDQYVFGSNARSTSKESDISDMMMSDSAYLVKKHLEAFYGKVLTKCEAGLVKTTVGASNGLHSDMYKLDGSQWDDGSGREDELEYSALLYLSEYKKDFVGGELFFPGQDLEIHPMPGTLVFFRGDLDHLHKVSTIRSGNRYAMIMFFGE